MQAVRHSMQKMTTSSCVCKVHVLGCLLNYLSYRTLYYSLPKIFHQRHISCLLQRLPASTRKKNFTALRLPLSFDKVVSLHTLNLLHTHTHTHMSRHNVGGCYCGERLQFRFPVFRFAAAESETKQKRKTNPSTYAAAL